MISHASLAVVQVLSILTALMSIGFALAAVRMSRLTRRNWNVAADQEKVDWHVVSEAVGDAISNAEGYPGEKELRSQFAKKGLLVLHMEDVA